MFIITGWKGYCDCGMRKYVLTAILLIGSFLSPSWCGHIPAIYNFGDSNSDTVYDSAAFGRVPSPNGGVFYGKPSGRYSDGRLIIDFIELAYPFWGDDGRPDGCGHPGFEITCLKEGTTISIMNVKYIVLDVNKEAQILKLTRHDYLKGWCPMNFMNTTLDFKLFDFVTGYENLTLVYGCTNNTFNNAPNFTCSIGESGSAYQNNGYIKVGAHGPGRCNANVVMPILSSQLVNLSGNLSKVVEALREGFEVKWKVDMEACKDCLRSEGVCGYDRMSNQTTCYCPNLSYNSLSCPDQAPKATEALVRILIEIPPCLGSLEDYTAWNNQFKCGTITAGFPFWGYDRPEGCGHPKLLLNCSGSNTAMEIMNINGSNTTMEIMNIKYRVLSLNSGTQTLRIAREDYLNGTCPSEVSSSTTLDDELFDYGPDYRNLNLHYGCPANSFLGAIPGHFSCTIDGTTNRDAYAALDESAATFYLCSKKVVVPILPIVTSSQDFTNFSKVEEALRRGFDVKWKVGSEECNECMGLNGACGYDSSSNRTTCYCKDQSSGSKT
ncbi:Leaf rust 10 disease-resistance locus receptor-like protein kinase [Quillaja saponaria]|uniref:non-specific serine/threonine protein kinase n=1 Tax=Quillaja saponaria TaxID=32244 RepID=A0AAD7VHB5_QUISA|nr:Leaf rust 10 disease-resistance locus receptor-like protein kinase [Quillaja saponaria]